LTFSEIQLKNPIEAVKNVSRVLNITEEKEKSILDFFMRGGDFSAMGVSQALTFYAHETKDADEAHEMEMAAIDVLPKIKDLDKPVVTKSVKTQMALN
jgi:hypothetical protein